MESFLPTATWQTSSSAEYFNCISPGSPVTPPSSPTLYANDGGVSPRNGAALLKDDFASSKRSQLATTLLRNLEEYGNLEQFQIQNEFENNWNEDISNLELFNELSEIEYAVPASPTPHEYDTQNQLVEFEVEDENDILTENEVEIFDQLSSEFQTIIESLPRTASVGNGEELVDITELIFDSPAAATVNFQLQKTVTGLVTTASVDQNDERNEQGNSSLQQSTNGSEDANADEMFMEIDVINAAAELGSNYNYLSMDESTSSLLSYTSMSSEEEDQQVTSNEKMLDALLVGNLDEATRYMPGVMSASDSFLASFGCDDIKIKQKQIVASSKSTKKSAPKRRTKKPKAPKIEKVIRKKEQNKTAALRYRIKKKQEVECTLEQENELQVVNDKLVKEKEELSKQVLMVKQLLRDVFQARKLSSKR